mmetsp:Transcript_18254/g.25720  ORF Transcript_18254/g.25720 Transcript_18254/m.25720 type:complete len:565 (+) Transcript_18254:130-1824(+)
MKGVTPIFAAVLVGKYYKGGGLDGVKEDIEWISTHVQGVASDGLDETTVEVIKKIAIIVAICLIAAFIFMQVINSMYQTMVKDNSIDIDPWVQQPNGPKFQSKIQLLFTNWLSAGGHKVRKSAVPLGEQESTFMKGLKVTVKEGEEKSVPHALSTGKLDKKPIVVGTIRMGFGHHRIAYAACSWSLEHEKDTTTYFHDLLNIDSPEATLIKDMDKAYSKGSRLASELGGPIEQLWGTLTLSGGADSLRATYQMGECVKPLLMGLPKDTPIVATHCLVALCAVACGFTNVINLVIDNHAQWFIVVPGALNLVQGPTNYANLLKMGVPPEELRLAGHWIPRDMVENLDADCDARIVRAKAGKPLRLLIPVGGAGAQRKFVSNLIKSLKKRVEDGDVQLFLNAGDHEHMRAAFVKALEDIGQKYDVVNTEQGVYDFCDSLRSGKEPNMPVTLFTFKDYFPAVATTDLVGRVTDVLACKPSELAFYPVPKLMIRRVGDHEAYSALRASELGDGTLEAREISDALRYVEMFKMPGSPLLVSMNEMIKKNGKLGIYDGCKNAIEIARQMQ